MRSDVVKVQLDKIQYWAYFVPDPQSEIKMQVRSSTTLGQLVYYKRIIITKKIVIGQIKEKKRIENKQEF